jgi:hypothetical protein
MDEEVNLSLTEIEVFGPDLTQELLESVRAKARTLIGIQVSDLELHWLVVQVRRARLSAPYVSGESYSAVDKLEKAAKRLAAVIRYVKSVASGPLVVGLGNVASDLIEDSIKFDSDYVIESIVYPTEELIAHLEESLEILQRRTKHAIETARVMKQGKGRTNRGYDIFIRKCRTIWDRHRQDKGWSKKAGRGSGPFVTFVHVAQDLLPPPMRKLTEAAVGDAVVATLKVTT